MTIAASSCGRSNQALDARIVTRAVELAGMQHALNESYADRLRLIASLNALNDEVERLGAARCSPPESHKSHSDFMCARLRASVGWPSIKLSNNSTPNFRGNPTLQGV